MFVRTTFFLVEQFLTYGWSSNFQHSMGGRWSMHLHHEGSMIGIQCYWWFVEDTLEHLRVHFKFFCGWQFYGKLTFKSNFALWSSFQVKFGRVINGLLGKNPLRAQSKYGLIGSRGNIFIGASQEHSFGSKHKSAICTSNLVYMCTGGFRGHKSELN